MTETEKKAYKDKIITEIYNSGEVQQKVLGICFRNHISKETYIHEDLISETFYHLAKHKTDEIIEMYEDNKRRIIGLAVCIAIRRTLKDKKNPIRPKHSLLTNILYASNLKIGNSVVIHKDEFDKDRQTTKSIPLYEETSLEDPEKELWDLIKSELTVEENEFLEYIINTKKKKGRYPKEIKDKRDALLERIKSIIDKYKIYINGQERNVCDSEETDGQIESLEQDRNIDLGVTS